MLKEVRDLLCILYVCIMLLLLHNLFQKKKNCVKGIKIKNREMDPQEVKSLSSSI